MVSLDGVIDGRKYLLNMQRKIVFLDFVEFLATPLAVAMSETPLDLYRENAVAGRPFKACELRVSATPSCTSAISRSRTDLSPGTMMRVSPSCFGGFGAPQHANCLFAAADLGAAAGRVQVDLAQLLIHFDGGQAQRLEPAGSDSTRISRSKPPMRCTCEMRFTPTRRLAMVFRRPAQLFRRHVGGPDRIDRKRSAVIVLTLDLRFQNALRQIRAHPGNGVTDIGDRPMMGIPILNSTLICTFPSEM